MTLFFKHLSLWLREWRQPSFRLLWVALFVAVFTVASITAFTARLKTVFDDGASLFLGGDLALESSRQIPSEWLTLAEELAIESAQTLEFASMLRAVNQVAEDDIDRQGTQDSVPAAEGDEGEVPDQLAQLVSVKAVDKGYPLKGEVGIAAELDADLELVRAGPEAGEIWLSRRLFDAFNIDIGDKVAIGQSELTVGAVLLKEPDPNFTLVNVAPRVVMHYADVVATGVVQPGSRLKYRLLMAASDPQLASFSEKITPQLSASERFLGKRQGSPAVSNALQRAERYLLLGGVLGVLLAAVALTIAAQFYAQQQKDVVALLKTLGSKTGQLLSRFTVLLGFSAVTAIVAGLLAGWLGEKWIAWSLNDLLPPITERLPLSWIWLPVVTLLIVLLAFAWPVFWRLCKEPPMSILRQGQFNTEMQRMLGYSWQRMLFSGLGLGALLWIYSGEPMIVLVILAALGAMIFIANLTMSLWIKISPPAATLVPGFLRSGKEQLKRRPWSTVPHILALSSAWTLLLTLFLVRTELIENWQAQVPENAPNHFLINIAADEVPALQQLITDNDIDAAPLYPMVRGRLTHINGEDVKRAVTKEREVGALNRELNLTWMADLPADNRLLQGQWWSDTKQDGVGVSVESQLAERLGLTIGDQLRFTIGGRLLDAQIKSVRSVQWDSLKPNFYMAFAPGALEDFSATYLTSAYIAPSDKNLVNIINRDFPTVSVLELDQFVEKIQQVIAQVSLAIEALLVMIFVAALLVVAALLAREVPVRKSETALYRALGAHRRVVENTILSEFAIIGCAAGIIGLVFAEFIAGYLQYKMFELEFTPHFGLWSLIPLLSAALTALYARWRLQEVLKVPPHQALQSGFVET